ncbi:MAG: hypothetical protein RJP95_03445 [Pirellulales bacterium]
MTRGDWKGVAERIAGELRESSGDQSVTYLLDDLLRMSGRDTEPEAYRSRSTWAAEQRGDEYTRAFRSAGLVLSFVPDEKGARVENVTFRLDRFTNKN